MSIEIKAVFGLIIEGTAFGNVAGYVETKEPTCKGRLSLQPESRVGGWRPAPKIACSYHKI